MIRRPPRSTLFPSRRSSDLWVLRHVRWAAATPTFSREPRPRSEEHTSELQSQFHLVCRLLLEKKNTSFRSLSPSASYRHDLELDPDSQLHRPHSAQSPPS